MTTTSPYDILFTPIKIGPVTAPNRFFASPHSTGHGWTEPNGAIALRAMKAEGGWGTVAVGLTEISPNSDYANHPMERIWDNSDLPRHISQVNAIKKHGALAAIELGHGGMQSRNLTTGLPIVGPSNLPALRPEIPSQSQEMDLSDIHLFRNQHKAAVKRSVEAGYDIIYVYAAHGLSILNHFLSINTNKRSDQYGGTFSNRIRLLQEVLEDTLDTVNGKCAVALRFGVAEPDKLNGLCHNGEGRDVVEALSELPDLWDVNLSGWPKDSQSARFTQEGYQQNYTSFVKSLTTKPVVGVGRFTSPDLMVSVIKKKQLDLIGGARPSIADPFLPSKIKDNSIENIRECIGCNVCVSMDAYGVPVKCTQNPTISEEWRKDWHPETPPITNSRESHLIIGAGPAGLECGLTLANAGHKVTIAEARDEPGGRVTKEGNLPGLSSWLRVRDYRVHQLSQKNDAHLYLSSKMTINDIIEFESDTVSIATGAKWRNDWIGSTNFEEIKTKSHNLLTPDDIMSNKTSNISPSSFIVYDDDHYYMASVITEKLLKDGHSVTYVTPLPTISTWTQYTLEQVAITEKLRSLGANFILNCKMTQNQGFLNLIDNKNFEINIKNLVFVGAKSSNNELFHDKKLMNSVKNIYLTGDCLAPRTIQAAVLSGHQVARDILSRENKRKPFKREQTIH
jgi:dimethylamine/trimethylamine dehydrogenase